MSSILVIDYLRHSMLFTIIRIIIKWDVTLFFYRFTICFVPSVAGIAVDDAILMVSVKYKNNVNWKDPNSVVLETFNLVRQIKVIICRLLALIKQYSTSSDTLTQNALLLMSFLSLRYFLISNSRSARSTH